jgi:hypothetical protein
MPASIEYKFEELNLILDPDRPTRAVGYFDGTAEIVAEPSRGYAIGDIWLVNTSANSPLDKFVLISPRHPLHEMFAFSLRAQFNRAIEDTIAAYLETA